MYELHLFKLLGFSNKDYATYKIISTSKKRNAGAWFFNNLWFPLLVVISPIGLTIVHHYFNTVAYQKTFLEILISGSFTLLGINVIRTASTAISEKLDESMIPAQLSGQVEGLIPEINSIKSKLDRRVWFITFGGWALYLLQIGQFVNTSHSFIYLILVIVIILTFTSILYGRFIFLMKTNVFDTEEVVSLLFGKLIRQRDDFNQLEDLLKKQGL
ncbi:MAG: hypothetical protein WDO19_27890 [Bacteroidota bacterium]